MLYLIEAKMFVKADSVEQAKAIALRHAMEEFDVMPYDRLYDPKESFSRVYNSGRLEVQDVLNGIDAEEREEAPTWA